MKGFITISVAFFLGIVIFTANSCKNENEEELFPKDPAGCDTTEVSLANDLTPLFESQCNSCHSAQSQQGGFNMEDFNTLQAKTLDGTMLEVLTLPKSNPRSMPLGGGSLTDCQIDKIRAWGNNGAINN